jgi:hypothetical protein
MPIYTVHVPKSAPDLVTQADQTIFVREGFSGRAFLFGLLYLLWHRLWIAAAAWVTLVVLITIWCLTLHPPAFAPVALLGLMHLFLGAEGPDLIRFSLDGQGRHLRDLVSAPDRGTAEIVFFHREAPPFPVLSQPAPAPTRARPPSSPSVIGMFPGENGA